VIQVSRCGVGPLDLRPIRTCFATRAAILRVG
jgi:hypothetical protein